MGFVVELVWIGFDGYYKVMFGEYELIILDVMLFDIDGWKILLLLWEFNNYILVFFFIVCDYVNDCVKGLEFGVDDYLVKLFVFVELLVCVCMLICCGMFVFNNILYIVDLEFDIFLCIVMWSGCIINLIIKEFILLELMVRC